MKFDPKSWNEVKTNEEIKHPQGRLRLRCSAPSPLYIKAEGREALVGVQTDFDVEVSQKVTFRLEAAKGVRAFRYDGGTTSAKAVGETFTNIDRLPMESGTMAEVTKGLRMLKLAQRESVLAIRAERDALRAEREAPQAVIEPEQADPAPAPEQPAQEAEK